MDTATKHQNLGMSWAFLGTHQCSDQVPSHHPKESHDYPAEHG